MTQELDLTQSEKRKMFLNFMFNELDITKEDIRNWIKESADKAAERMVAQEFGKFDVQKIVQDMVTSNKFYGSRELKTEVMNALIKELASRVTLQVVAGA